jgi:hypothetical protein
MTRSCGRVASGLIHAKPSLSVAAKHTTEPPTGVTLPKGEIHRIDPKFAN